VNTVKIGWAKREISIKEPVGISGQSYLRISQGIHDPLYVTVLIVDGGEGQDQAIFCSCDVSTLTQEAVDLTLEEVARRDSSIPTQFIIMNSTHTHSSSSLFTTPDRSSDGRYIYSTKKYVPFFVKQAADAICEAWNSRSEGGIAYGYGYAVVGHSRRVVYLEDQETANPMSMAPNGYAVMYGNTRKPAFSHFEAGADHFVNLMYTVDSEKNLTGVVINVPCPSQTSEVFTVLSADFWHEVREAVKKEFGEHVFVLPHCAPAGDTSPRLLHYKEAQQRRMEIKYGLPYDATQMHAYNKVMGERYDIAERILQAVKEVYAWARKDIQTQLTVRHDSTFCKFKRRLVTAEEKQHCEETIERMRSLIPDESQGTPEEIDIARGRYNTVKRRNEGAIERFVTQTGDETVDRYIHVVQIGEIAFATNPFELYQDFMHRIQARSPFIQTFVVQLAGAGVSGYLATERAAKNKGYSASIFCNWASYEGGQQLVEHTLKVLNEMKDKE